MKFKYTLPKNLIEKAKVLREFTNGGMQVSMRLKSGDIFSKILLSNATWVVAMRDHKDLPFRIDEIEDVFQAEEDKTPENRGGWEFWDDWPIKGRQ